MRTAIAVCARLASTRLPMKAMLPLAGEPMIGRVLERALGAQALLGTDSFVVLATGPKADNAALVAFVEQAFPHVPVWCDDEEEDVLGRLFRVVTAFNAARLVRITADNPCIDPQAIKLVCNEQARVGLCGMLYSNTQSYRHAGWPNCIGAEVWSRRLLTAAHDLFGFAEEREHPHRWFETRHRIVTPLCPAIWCRPALRLDVDTSEDYERIRMAYDALGPAFTPKELIDYCEGPAWSTDARHG